MYKSIFLAVFLVKWLVCFAQNDSLSLSYNQLNRITQLPLHCVEIEYPNKLNQVLTDSSFLNSPENLHPVFYGCFDWHSSVHGYWLLVKAMNKFPESEMAETIVALLDKKITTENIKIELAYFEPTLEKSFERTYGWAWLLKLVEELSNSKKDQTHLWTKKLQPLSDFVVESYKSFLPKLLYPIRVGEHTNTAFGLSLALDYAVAVKDTVFSEMILVRAKEYYLNDCDCPINWEPSGFDFISPCLMEAELMSKVLKPRNFEKWLRRFLPQLFKKNLELEPGKVLDRTDGKLVHLDGLNFSRAWCFYTLAKVLPKYANQFLKIGDEHLLTSKDFVAGSDYMGSHWLATFLVYALDKREQLIATEN